MPKLVNLAAAVESQLKFLNMFDHVPRVDTRTPREVASGMSIDDKIAQSTP